MYGREAACELVRCEVLRVADLAAASCRAQDAERIAQNEVRPAAVGGVERGVREGDRPRHAGESAPHAADAEPGRQEQRRRAQEVAAPSFDEAFGAYAAAVAPGQQPDQRCAREPQVPVLGEELSDERQRVVVVGEEHLVGREALLRVAEVDRVGEVRRDDEEGVDRQVVAVEHPPVEPRIADPGRQGQQCEQDEEPVGVDDRRRVELQRPAQQGAPLAAERAELLGVVEVEEHAAEHQHRIEQGDAPHGQQQRSMEQSFHGVGCSVRAVRCVAIRRL